MLTPLSKKVRPSLVNLAQRNGVLRHHRLSGTRVSGHKDGTSLLHRDDRLLLEWVQVERILKTANEKDY